MAERSGGYLGDFADGATVYCVFDSWNNATAGKDNVTTTGFVVADISVYKNGSATQRTSTSGYTVVATDFDGHTGMNLFSVDLSDDTDSGFYAAGNEYFVVINSVTIDTSAVNLYPCSFSIERAGGAISLLKGTNSLEDIEDKIDLLPVISDIVSDSNPINTTSGAIDNVTLVDTTTNVSNLASGSAAISTIAGSFTNTDGGTETNTYTSTHQLDGILHSVAPNAGNTDGYYEFSIGGTGVPVEVIWEGYANSNGDSYAVYGYNYGAASYEQIGTVTATNQTTVGQQTFIMTSVHVGSGADLGKVRFRFDSADGTNISTDRILCSYTAVDQSSGYVNGAVWYDSSVSNTNTELGVDGIITNPVSSEASARTIANSANLKRIQCAPGSTYTLDQSYEKFQFDGFNYVLALNGKSVDNSSFAGAVVSGNDSGTNPSYVIFSNCRMLGNTLGLHALLDCVIAGDMAISEAGAISWLRCVASSILAVPKFDFGGGLNASNLTISKYSNDLELENMGAGTGAYTVCLEGNGALVIAASCSATSTIFKRGQWSVEDNAGGEVTIVEDEVSSEVSEILADTAAISTLPTDLLTTQMTEAYAANGVAPTMAESLFAIHQMLMEFSISGTAYTVKKLDGATTAFVVTLDSATNPTGATR